VTAGRASAVWAECAGGTTDSHRQPPTGKSYQQQQAPSVGPCSPIALVANTRLSVISASRHFLCAMVLGRQHHTTDSDLSLSIA
jgi:hypothetical protein